MILEYQTLEKKLLDYCTTPAYRLLLYEYSMHVQPLN